MNVGIAGLMYQAFNPDRMVLLIGGSFKNQNLISTDLDASKYEKDQIPNLAYMNYRKKPYYLMLPVGKLETSDENDDDRSIFE